MKLALLGGIAASLAFASSATAATTVDGNFSNLETGGNSGNYYFFVGHEATQDFNGTGLDYVDSFDIVLTIDENVLSAILGFTFSINGVDIGTFSYAPNDGTGTLALSYTFGPIATNSGSFQLGARVTDPVASGQGSISFGSTNLFTAGYTGAVPEPATWALLILGFGFVGGAMRRAKATNVTVSYA